MTQKSEHGNEVAHVATQLTRILSRHGHAFQHGVTESLNPFYGGRLWAMEACEIPFLASNEPGRCDLVLKYTDGPAFMAAECKRPLGAHWCFLKANHSSAEHIAGKRYIFEGLYAMTTNLVFARAMKAQHVCDCFHVGIVLRQKDSQDDGGSSQARNELDQAAAQALRGAYALASYHARDIEFVRQCSPIFLPAVITTAKLWSCSTDLSKGDWQSGVSPTIDIKALKAERMIAYQFPVPHDLVEALERRPLMPTLSRAVEQYFLRTVLIINAEALADFAENWHVPRLEQPKD